MVPKRGSPAESMSGFDRLPDGVVGMILRKLDRASDGTRVMLASKRFRDIAGSEGWPYRPATVRVTRKTILPLEKAIERGDLPVIAAMRASLRPPGSLSRALRAAAWSGTRVVALHIEKGDVQGLVDEVADADGALDRLEALTLDGSAIPIGEISHASRGLSAVARMAPNVRYLRLRVASEDPIALLEPTGEEVKFEARYCYDLFPRLIDLALMCDSFGSRRLTEDFFALTRFKRLRLADLLGSYSSPNRVEIFQCVHEIYEKGRSETGRVRYRTARFKAFDAGDLGSMYFKNEHVLVYQDGFEYPGDTGLLIQRWKAITEEFERELSRRAA